MHSDGHTVFIRHVGDFFQFQSTAAGKDIRMNNRHTASFDQRLKTFFEIDIFSGAYRDRGCATQTLILLGIHPRREIFDPGEVVFFHPAAEAYTAFKLHVAKVVHRKRYFIPDYFTYFLQVVFQIIQPFFRNLDAGVRMACGDDLITPLVLYHIRSDGSALHIENMGGILFHFIEEAERSTKSTGNIHQKPDSEIHFQKGKSHFHPALESQPHRMSGVVLAVHVGVTVDTDPVAIFSAKQLPHGNPPRFSRQIP